jgi:hypothetical protein
MSGGSRFAPKKIKKGAGLMNSRAAKQSED